MREIHQNDDDLLVKKIATRVFKPNRCWPSASPELTRHYIASARKISGIGNGEADKTLKLEQLLRDKQADEITCLESFALLLDYISMQTRMAS